MKRYPIPAILAALALGGCAAGQTPTDFLDANTGTTLEERCGTRRAAIATYEALERQPSKAETAIYSRYVEYVELFCPAVAGAAEGLPIDE